MRFQKFPNSWGPVHTNESGYFSETTYWVYTNRPFVNTKPVTPLTEIASVWNRYPERVKARPHESGFKKVWICVDGALVYSKLSAVTVNFGREPWQSILTSLPPRVHNNTPLLSHHLMIPMPCLGVNWFTNYKMKNKRVTLNAVHSTENISDFLVWKHNK